MVESSIAWSPVGALLRCGWPESLDKTCRVCGRLWASQGSDLASSRHLAETKFELKSQSLKPTALLAVITEKTLFLRFVLKVCLGITVGIREHYIRQMLGTKKTNCQDCSCTKEVNIGVEFYCMSQASSGDEFFTVDTKLACSMLDAFGQVNL